jgi:phenylalanyl-tRNA synthetase alpha subunit
VLAWGLGIERMLLMKDSRIKTISELYNNGVGWSRKM